MGLNSTVISNNSLKEDERASPSTVKMLVNTTDFNGEDLEEYITLTERIERCTKARQSKQKQKKSNGNTLKAKRTREEFFEAINLDDDRYLEAMEHNTCYDDCDTSKLRKDRQALVQSIENLMKYFDEDCIPITSDSSAKATPIKKTKTRGRVASLVASFRSKNNSTSSAHSNKRKTYQRNATTTNIQELKKKYEESNKEEVNNLPSPPKVKIKSPKLLRKTKVKQMASVFNNKIHHQSIETNSNESPRTSASLSSDLESPIRSPIMTSTLKSKSSKFIFKYPKFFTKIPSPRPSPLMKRKSLNTKCSSIASLNSSSNSGCAGAGDKKSNPLLEKLKKMPSLSSLLSHSPRMKRKQLEKEKQSLGPTCLVAENVFSQLSVKDKALLYNKFIEDMAKQNPKFGKHAQALETHVKKEMQRGEVVIEKQNSVKYLRDSIEAKFRRQNIRTNTWQRFKKTKPAQPLGIATKSKEYEDILQSSSCSSPELDEESLHDPLHVTTLTVVLRSKSPAEDEKQVKRKAKVPVKKNVTFVDDVKSSPPPLKRPQKLIRPLNAVEPLAPPKKIRRTKHDRFRPKIIFKNTHLEQLFYHWLKEQNGVSFDITAIGNQQNVIEILAASSADDDVLPAEEFQKMLEAAINNLESEQQNAVVLIKNAMDDEEVLEKSVIELELPLNSTNKESESDSNQDLGLSAATKTTSVDSQTDLNAHDTTQPLRKRKWRRSLSLRRNNSMLETAKQGATTITATSTDSDSDATKAEKSQTQQPQSCYTLPKSSKCGNYAKKLVFKTLPNSPNSTEAKQQNLATCSNELSIVELDDDSWLRKVNSPSKIKNAYTLTVISSPSPATGSGSSEDDLPTRKSSRSWPSLTEAELLNKNNRRLKDENDKQTKQETMQQYKLAQEKLKQLMDNFIDQGFETASNDMESPLKLNRKPRSNPQNYSTPNKTNSLQQNFNANDSTLSPIRHNNSRRRQPSHLNMTVIREHGNSTEGLEKLNESATFLIESQQQTAATYTLPSCSQFWVTCGEFTAALAIQYYEGEHLMLLSNIFAQKVSQGHAIDFGIDKQKFSWNGMAELDDMLMESVPCVEDCSQYWFATGDTLIPFSGKPMSPEKISNFFNYIRSFMSDSKSSLRFGIDAYEFCLSQEHNLVQHLNLNSMFYGLNGLATPTSSHIKTSDLDASDFDSGEFDPSLTFSVSNGQQCDLISLKSQPECSSLDCMEQILSDAKLLNLSKSETDKLAMEAQLSVPDMLRTLQNQKYKLETLVDRMQHCSSSTLDMQKFKDLNQNSPELMRKLRNTVTAIENMGHSCGFNMCTLQQLESFMFFLSRYADLCLASCTHHIEQIMEVVLTQRTTLPIQN